MALIAAAWGLLNQGLVEKVSVGLAEETWRSGDDSRGLRITEVGLRAIGVPALVSGLEARQSMHRIEAMASDSDA